MIATQIIKWVDYLIKPLIWLTVALLFWEIGLKTSHSTDFFLWAERCIAVVFTLEYFARWYEDKVHPDGSFDVGVNYPLSAMGVIDLLSVLPFWLGFCVPVGWLGWIRALRIIRLLKMFRYWRSLQLVALGFYRAWPFLKPLLFALLIVTLFAAVIIYECEHIAQPDKYGEIGNCFWFALVSATTVGYGDMSPVTPIGKMCAAIILFVPAIFIFSAVVGTIGGSFQASMATEVDESDGIDPLEEFRKIWKSRHLTKPEHPLQ